MARTQILVHSWGPEQGFRRCFADGLNQSLVLSAAQATKNIDANAMPMRCQCDANASNRGRVCLLLQNDTKLVDLQIVQL